MRVIFFCYCCLFFLFIYYKIKYMILLLFAFSCIHVSLSQSIPMCLDLPSSYMGTPIPFHYKPCPPLSIQPRSYLRSTPSLDITFHCLHTEPLICNKAERAFKKAADIISSTILFKETVKVNATMMSFCQVNGECGKNMMTLGGSSPARSMPLLNSDGMTRLHPQALVKQFGLVDHPAYAPFDIVGIFNADAPFWFEVNIFSRNILYN